MKKVSVIVPVYNVERYLKRCIDSIIKQTYKNLEIILVDDGSTDESGKLCDELECTDSRIIVIHKENGGLSDARNVGLDSSTGEYISFIDSDDFVDDNFIEVLVDKLEKHDADISCCRYKNVWVDGKKQYIGNDESLNVYNCIEGLKQYFLAKTVDPFVCNKIYKSTLIGNQKYTTNNIRFVKGDFGEDIKFNIEAFSNSSFVVQNGLSLYNYQQNREGALTNSVVSQKRIESVFRWEQIRLDIKQKYPEIERYVLRRQVLFYIGLYNRVYRLNNYDEIKKKIRSFLKNNLKDILNSDICEYSIKISSFLIVKNVWLYNIIMRGYKKIVGEARL